jgi:uncharacterized membrane protein
MNTEPAPAQELPKAAADNIELVLRLREEAWRHRTPGERLADAVGSLVGHGGFVALHAVLFLAWAAFNTRLVPWLPQFDPYPFNLFGVLISLEALVVAAFVLIKQNRQGMMAERRAHLELQMILLTEKEVTKLIRIMERVTSHLGIPDAVDGETHELGEVTEVEGMFRTLHDKLPMSE